MRSTFKKLVFLLTFYTLLVSCKSGPWFIRKNVYTIYKEEIYKRKDSTHLIRTDGYYIQTGNLHPNVTSSRSVLIFLPNGYLTSAYIDDENPKSSETELFEKLGKSRIELDWYQVDGHTLIVEYFGNAQQDMTTSVYYQRGTINSDSTLELKFDDLPNRVYHYKFVKKDMPKIINKGIYLTKKWYEQNLHITRR